MASRSHFLLGVALVAVALPFVPAAAQDSGALTPNAGTQYETRLSAVEDQLRTLTGKVEQLDYTMRRYDQAVQRMQADFETRIKALENAPPVVVQAPALIQGDEASGQGDEAANPETAVKGSLGALKMQDNKVTGGLNKPKAPALPETPEGYGLTPQEQYDRAFSLLRQANYEGAEKAFKAFIDNNPKDKLIDNAKYWYAETFYVRAKYQDAAVAFGDAYQANPKGNKAPDSLLKLALALGALEKKQDACTTLAELKSKYPNAPATIRARAAQEHTKLKCGAKKR